MKRTDILWIGALLTAILINSAAYADRQVSGDVWGTWRAEDGQIIVVGDISLSSDSTLYIEPGVQVRVMGDYTFEVRGILIAAGDEGDSIRFFANNGNPDAWNGIYFSGGSASRSGLDYCIIEHAHRGVETVGANITVSNCRLSNHDHAGIRISGASPLIVNCIINNIHSNGIAVLERGAPTISGCIISNCGEYGIGLSSGSRATIVNNLVADAGSHSIYITGGGSSEISGNTIQSGGDHGIHIEQTDGCTVARNIVAECNGVGFWNYRSTGTVYTNNTSLNNGNTGFYLYTSDQLRLVNNISVGNSGNGIFAQNSVPLLRFNDIWNNIRDDYEGLEAGEEDISENPALDEDFVPAEDSPVVDAGDPGIIDPDGTRSDIGARFYNQNHPPVITAWSPQDMDTLRGGGEITFTVSAEDEDGHALSYVWSLNGRNVQVGVDTSWTNTFELDGEFEVTVVVDDRFYLGTAEHTWSFIVEGAAVRDEPDIPPAGFALEGPYPNPFNDYSRVLIRTGSPGGVNVALFDLRGAMVRPIFAGDLPAGVHNIAIHGSGLPAGLYILRARTWNSVQERSLLHLK